MEACRVQRLARKNQAEPLVALTRSGAATRQVQAVRTRLSVPEHRSNAARRPKMHCGRRTYSNRWKCSRRRIKIARLRTSSRGIVRWHRVSRGRRRAALHLLSHSSAWPLALAQVTPTYSMTQGTSQWMPSQRKHLPERSPLINSWGSLI